MRGAILEPKICYIGLFAGKNRITNCFRLILDIVNSVVRNLIRLTAIKVNDQILINCRSNCKQINHALLQIKLNVSSSSFNIPKPQKIRKVMVTIFPHIPDKRQCMVVLSLILKFCLSLLLLIFKCSQLLLKRNTYTYNR